MNRYEARFNAVKKWYAEFIDKANKNNCDWFMYCGDMLPLKCLVLNHEGLHIHYPHSGNENKIIQCIFDSDIECDGGMHTSIKGMFDNNLSHFKLFKEL